MKNTYLVNLSIDSSKYSKYLSNTLITKIEENFKKNNKVILYLNQRWAFSSMICSDCSYLFKCKNCDLKMYVHNHPAKLFCHFCSFSREIPLVCDKCKWTNLLNIWFWTQSLEKIIKQIFPEKKVFRFDTDNISWVKEKKEALEKLKKSDIIIWTKMITTGFDLENIWLISIILLEAELSIPKYDIEEKTYINLKQLIWRWWRKGQKTDILIQTFIPDNPFVKQVFQSNYKEFLKETLLERKIFNYPPFSELFTLQYKNHDKNNAFLFMENLEEKLKKFLEKQNIKNIEIIFNKTSFKRNNQFFYNIILKWKNIEDFLRKTIKNEILKNKDLSLISH